MTVKGRYLDDLEKGWRIVAALEIIKRFHNHEEAARWYQAQGPQRLPGNCMVKGNPPLPVERSHGGSGKTIERWDAGYRWRARQWPDFLACKTIRMDLVNPPQILKPEYNKLFGKKGTDRPPSTLSGLRIDPKVFEKLLAYLPDHVVVSKDGGPKMGDAPGIRRRKGGGCTFGRKPMGC